MRAMTSRVSRFLIVAAVSALLVSAFATTGCSLVDSDPELVSVADNTGFYHVKIPSTWVSRTDPGVVTMYAADTLPESDILEDPVVLVFLSEQPAEESLGEMLTTLVDQRAESREWKTGYSIGEPYDIEVGGRDGAALHVEATDAADVDFQADFYLIRTAGREVLVMAVAPTGDWDEFADQLDGIRSEWFWHIPHETGTETTATPEATETE